MMDPAVRFYVPVLRASADGWWFQIARRLIWVTSETNDEGRLLEPLLDGATASDEVIPLAATEPILIAAPMTQQPLEWAFTARIWTDEVQRPNDRPWSRLAEAIHGHGIPTITLDPASTPQEIACQVVLKGYWHGYIGADEPALASAVATAYPQPVEHIRRQTHAPTRESAVAMLLEQLIRPGFDPAQGAEATRRYVRQRASIVVKEHKKQEAPDRYPWTHVGISERRYYKLLPQFAEKVNGRYDYDHGDVVARMKAQLEERDRKRAIRTATLDLLRSRGFSEAAARKWLQRHEPETSDRCVATWSAPPMELIVVACSQRSTGMLARAGLVTRKSRTQYLALSVLSSLSNRSARTITAEPTTSGYARSRPAREVVGAPGQERQPAATAVSEREPLSGMKAQKCYQQGGRR